MHGYTCTALVRTQGASVEGKDFSVKTFWSFALAVGSVAFAACLDLPDGPISFPPSGTGEHPVNACSNGQPDDGEMGIDCGGPCDGCSDGAPCESDKDCEHGFCADQYGSDYGACFGPDLDGCMRTIPPSDEIKSACLAPDRWLVICGAGYTPIGRYECTVAGAGLHDEVYYCCPPMLP